MKSTTDIVVASADAFDAILADLRNTLPLDVTSDSNVTIDDVVSIVSIHRDAIDDRSAWWRIRREINARFASHEAVATRMLAAIPDPVRDELAMLTGQEIALIASRWGKMGDSPAPDPGVAVLVLERLVSACTRARESGLGVLLRTNQPANDFEIAFTKVDCKRRRNFQKAFDDWDDSKRYEAHQRYNYYLKQGVEDCLDRVLRDFTRRKTSRLNLNTDQRRIRKYISKRVKNYIKSPSPALGDPGDPVTMITLEFDIEYEGYVDLVFHSRPDAAEAIEFVEDTGFRLELTHWHEGMERFACDDLPLKVTLPDERKVVVEPSSDGDDFEKYIGDMLRDTMVEQRRTGAFGDLPISESCVLCVGGGHTNYFWLSDDVVDS